LAGSAQLPALLQSRNSQTKVHEATSSAETPAAQIGPAASSIKQQLGGSQDTSQEPRSPSHATGSAETQSLGSEGDVSSAQGAAARAAGVTAVSTHVASQHADAAAAAEPATLASPPSTVHPDCSSKQQLSGPAAAIFQLLSSAEQSVVPDQQQPQPDSTEVVLLKQALEKAAEEHQVMRSGENVPSPM
jgi:hypothetical protein